MITFTSFPVYILVFARLAAAFFTNPIFSRRNVPSIVKMGLIATLTLVVVPLISTQEVASIKDLELLLLLIKELFIGICMGFIFTLFFQMIFFAGDLLDFHFGFSISKVFDPDSKVQISPIGTYFQVLFMLLFFVTNSHLLLIRSLTSSFQYIEIFQLVSLQNIIPMIIDLFLSVFMMAIHIALPFIVTEFLLEIAMGILMKLIPQIHVFVINIQLKIILGIALLFIFIGPITNYLNTYIGKSIYALQELILKGF